MKILLLSFCFFVCIVTSAHTANTYFRCDYSYINEIFGYLKYHEIPATWREARHRCRLEGAILASPLNQRFQEAMLQMVKGITGCGIFTGISSLLSKGYFKSLEGIPLSQIPHKWAKFEPDSENNEESCIAMMLDGNMADANCSEPLPFFCYRQDNKTALVNSCGTTDLEYNFDQRTGQCYKFHRIARIWADAQMVCSAEGGSLAIINNEQEAAVLRDLFAKNPAGVIPGPVIKDNAMVGIYKWKEDVVFTTLDGQTLKEAGYDKFSPGEPNNYQGIQFCGAIYRNALFDDFWCEKEAVFICEKSPNSLLCPDGEELKKEEKVFYGTRKI